MSMRQRFIASLRCSDEYVLIDVGCLKELGIEWSEQKPTTAAC
jgi:hypothetical protein